MKKVLFVAHVDSHIRHFHIPYLKFFKEKGYEVHVATSNDENEQFPFCDKKHIVNFERSPFKLNNIKAIKQMKELLNEESYDIVHCHTPMGGVVTRLACKKARNNGTKILYTAHGFHFYKGAPLLNWLVYYPVEKYLSKYTDILITINHEDYKLASTKLKANKVEFVHGVGVDDKKFSNGCLPNDVKNKLELELNIRESDFKIVYVAELIKRKNQLMLIDAMRDIVKKNNNIKVYFVGSGALRDYYNEKVKIFGLNNNIFFTGYRRDVCNLLKTMDLCVATSLQEGLPINIVEAELSGLPVLAKNSRGHNEVIKNGENGFLFNNKDELIEKIITLSSNKNLLNELKENARNSVKIFSLENAYKEQVDIYKRIL